MSQRISSKFITTLGVLLISVLLVLLKGQTVRAISWVLPDYDQFTNSGGTPGNINVHLEIAQASTGPPGITIDAPETWVKAFMNPAQSGNNAGIELSAADFVCNQADPNAYFRIDSQGLNKDCDTSQLGAVEYNFYCSTSDGRNPDLGNPAANFYNINSDDPKFQGTGYHEVFDGPTQEQAISCPKVGTGAEARYIVYMRAHWRNAGPPEGRINGFKFATDEPGSLASYWAGGSDYAVQNRVDQMPGEDRSFNFEFAPQCDDPATQPASLVWTDADSTADGGVPGDDNISFDLFEGDSQAGPWTTLAHVDGGGLTGSGASWVIGNNIGGNLERRQLQFNAQNNKVYSWKWYNVNYDNGVQMTLPFDSYYYQKNCPPPSSGGDHGVFGRVFNDLNGNGLYEPGSGEKIIQSSNVCSETANQMVVSGVSVTADGTTGNIDKCNLGGGRLPPGGSYALYQIRTTNSGSINVHINAPPGWLVTSKGPDRTVSVPSGDGYNGPATEDDYFGIRKVDQGVQGRVFIDDNNDGLYQSGEKIIENPNKACPSPDLNLYVPGVTVTGTTAPGNPTSNLSYCNAAAGRLPGPGNYALYQVPTPSGSQTVKVNLPADWIVNSKGLTRTYTVPSGSFTGPTTEDDYFGILPRSPDVVPVCNKGKSQAQVSWPTAGFSGISNYYVDISTSKSFSTYSTRRIGPSAPRSLSDVPNNFSGTITAQLSGAQPSYFIRIYYEGPNVHSDVKQFTPEKCPHLICGTLQPTDAESNEPIDMRVSFTNDGQGPLANTAKLGVSYPGYSNANTPYSPFPLPGGNTTAISNSGAIPFTKTAGVYRIDWTVTGDSRSNDLNNVPVECSGTIKVTDKPYFRAYGSDVVVGITQPPGTASCPGWNSAPSSTILTFGSSTGKGAGVQLAAFALGQIDPSGGFSSAVGKLMPSGVLGTGSPPKSLTFANTDPLTFGGNSQLSWCPPDYFANAAASGLSSPSSAFLQALTTPLWGMDSGSYFYDTSSGGGPLGLSELRLNDNVFKSFCIPLPLAICRNLGKDTRITVYVKGNVIIDGNITYDTSNWSVGKIPSLYIIVKGNIYIQPNVTQIDGVYVAQESSPGADGKIYTCANGTSVPDAAYLIDNCRDPAKRLVINGSLIAQHLRLFRLWGTRYAGQPQDLSDSTNIAEMITSGPETWLTVPAPYPPATPKGYDAATSLPPTL